MSTNPASAKGQAKAAWDIRQRQRHARDEQAVGQLGAHVLDEIARAGYGTDDGGISTDNGVFLLAFL